MDWQLLVVQSASEQEWTAYKKKKNGAAKQNYLVQWASPGLLRHLLVRGLFLFEIGFSDVVYPDNPSIVLFFCFTTYLGSYCMQVCAYGQMQRNGYAPCVIPHIT